MSRLLNQLKSMHSLPDNKKVTLPNECMLDIKWWGRYLRKFNGVELIYPTDPLDLSLDQLLDTTAVVNCGDANLWVPDPTVVTNFGHESSQLGCKTHTSLSTSRNSGWCLLAHGYGDTTGKESWCMCFVTTQLLSIPCQQPTSSLHIRVNI